MPSAAVGSCAALRMRPGLYGYTSARVSDGHIFSRAWEKIWKKRTLFQLKNRRHVSALKPDTFLRHTNCLSMFWCRKSLPLLVTAESVL